LYPWLSAYRFHAYQPPAHTPATSESVTKRPNHVPPVAEPGRVCFVGILSRAAPGWEGMIELVVTDIILGLVSIGRGR
jgi:hypothetical protein